jgi:hypothetical protein
LNGFHLS